MTERLNKLNAIPMRTSLWVRTTTTTTTTTMMAQGYVCLEYGFNDFTQVRLFI
jgi:hypothetical protein